MIDLTNVVNAFLALLFAVISAVALPWIRQRISAEKMDTLVFWIDTAVKAAEMIFVSGAGEQKKEYVMNFLASKGYAVNTVEINNMVEAAVLELKKDIVG